MPDRYLREFESDSQLLAWYKNHRWYHGRLARLVAQFLEWQIEDFFADQRLPVLAKISSRDKSADSLEINLKKKRYGSFPIGRDRVADLAGVRVVFYFRDDVENFCDERAKLFRYWFGSQSFDLRQVKNGAALSARQGATHDYDSWHFPVRVEPETDFYRALNEMDRAFLEGLYCEVQLRTILQDAWAESNHDIRYKLARVDDTPRNEAAERKFHRLAEQLRSADETLVELKNDFVTNVQARAPDIALRDRHWRYATPPYPRPARVGDVEYSYELLDGAGKDGAATPFSIAAATTVFNVDEVMETITGTKRYKQVMWDQLRREEAQFVVAITYDSMVVRATGWDKHTRTLGVELAAYSDQVVTNHKRVQGKTIPGDPNGRVVRDLAVDSNGELYDFHRSPLSNTVGVSCMIRTHDGSWIVGLRSPSVAFDPGIWGCPTSGALNWVELGHWDKRDFDGWFKNGIVREVEEELGYTPDPEDVHYLGLAREFGRLGKPQVFFFIDAKIRRDYLITKFRTYRLFDSEYQELQPLSVADARKLISGDEALVNSVCSGADVGEELRFNLALALDFTGEIDR